jgi:hypothetical protein
MFDSQMLSLLFSMKNHRKIMIILVISLSGLACSSRKSEIDRSNIVPRDELTEIITDLYLTDGLMVQPTVHDWYNPADTLGAYKDVIESYGYTREDFERTMRFYFIKKPKQLVRIYDQALARLSEMESRSEQELLQLQSRISNTWNGKDLYAFPDPSDSLTFDLRLPYPTTYAINLTVTLYPGNDPVNPRMTAFTCHPDSLENGIKNYINTINYISDGNSHSYKFLIRPLQGNRLRFAGKLFDYDSDPGNQPLNVVIRNISIGTFIAEE